MGSASDRPRAPAFWAYCCLSGIRQHAKRAVHGFTVWESFDEVGIDQHEVRASGYLVIIFATNAALQLREIILRSQAIRFLVTDAFFTLSSLGPRSEERAYYPESRSRAHNGTRMLLAP
jgi:hypothetical protein